MFFFFLFLRTSQESSLLYQTYWVWRFRAVMRSAALQTGALYLCTAVQERLLMAWSLGRRCCSTDKATMEGFTGGRVIWSDPAEHRRWCNNSRDIISAFIPTVQVRILISGFKCHVSLKLYTSNNLSWIEQKLFIYDIMYLFVRTLFIIASLSFAFSTINSAENNLK